MVDWPQPGYINASTVDTTRTLLRSSYVASPARTRLLPIGCRPFDGGARHRSSTLFALLPQQIYQFFWPVRRVRHLCLVSSASTIFNRRNDGSNAPLRHTG